jgi:ATP-dependent Lhr-like helicase
MTVQFITGGRIATVEESFIARLRAGDVFLLGGRQLALVRTEGLTAYVRLAKSGRALLPRWGGGQLPISDTLAQALLERLAQAARGEALDAEMQAVMPLLQLQAQWSALPTPQTLVAETLTTADGHHCFVYPFAGRTVHLGLAALLAWRLARDTPATLSMAVNDYGLELLSATPMDWAAVLPAALAPADTATLRADVLASLNAGELARRRFREIARISGLIFQSHPGEARSQRQLQASSSLYYEVFRQHDPDNRLLRQAEEELLSQELAVDDLARTLQTLAQRALVLRPLVRPTPLALPLMVERLRERLTTETLEKRLGRMLAELEAAAGANSGGEAGGEMGAELGAGTGGRTRGSAAVGSLLQLAEQLRFDSDAAKPPPKRAPRRRQ